MLPHLHRSGQSIRSIHREHTVVKYQIGTVHAQKQGYIT
jgi:hypothetical protein